MRAPVAPGADAPSGCESRSASVTVAWMLGRPDAPEAGVSVDSAGAPPPGRVWLESASGSVAAGGTGFGTGRRTTRSLITTSADGAGRREGVGVDVPLVDRAGGGVSVRRWIIGPTTPRPSASEAAETEPTTRATMSQPDLGEPSTVGE